MYERERMIVRTCFNCELYIKLVLRAYIQFRQSLSLHACVCVANGLVDDPKLRMRATMKLIMKIFQQLFAVQI